MGWDVPVIYVSAHEVSPGLGERMVQRSHGFFKKPVDAGGLMKTVLTTMGGVEVERFEV